MILSCRSHRRKPLAGGHTFAAALPTTMKGPSRIRVTKAVVSDAHYDCTQGFGRRSRRSPGSVPSTTSPTSSSPAIDGPMARAIVAGRRRRAAAVGERRAPAAHVHPGAIRSALPEPGRVGWKDLPVSRDA
jgi:hypothetical protein